MPQTALDDQSALDFAFLRAEGVRQLERLAGEVWTDFNTHDPGITILEQLCYALTDLAYRAGYDVADLLASASEEPYASLLTPAQILPTNPVTVEDLRRVAIDVPGVKNAWVDIVDEPIAVFDSALGDMSYFAVRSDPSAAPTLGPNASEIRVKGLYRVSIEKSDLDIEGGVLRRAVARRLNRFRALGEDFHEIRVLAQQPVRLKAVLEIDAMRHPPKLLAEVYACIADYISPRVPFCTLEEMLARGRRVDEIFEGPLLEHGFIDAQDLARIQRRRTLRLSDLIRELMSVPGVIAVTNLQFYGADGQPSRDWLLSIDADKTPRFDLLNSDIQVHRQGLRVDHDGMRAAARSLFGEYARIAAVPPSEAAQERDLRPPEGRDRQVGSYRSVLHDFPAVYGIGPGGLPESASPVRKAQAKQLKAYLMFFDQTLANQFAQLANATRLFSFRDSAADSYFCQLARDDAELGLDGLRFASRGEHLATLQQITEVEQSGVRRRNRFLDHLLARFGERVRDYSILRPPGSEEDAQFEERLAQYKRALLRDYARLSWERGRGFNYLEPAGDSPEGNVSGLELVLRRKLGVTDDDERFYLVEHILLRPLPGDVYQQGPLFRDACSSDPYSLQVTAVFPNWPARFTDEDFRAFVERTVREETPAHLAVRVLWKSRADMEAFRAAHAAWLARWRAYRLAELEL